MRSQVTLWMYVIGVCKKLAMTKPSKMIQIMPQNNTARGRESSISPVCQLRVNKNENTKIKYFI